MFETFAEYLSTCWMTFILLGVSFLVFYAIGMIAFKHQPYIVLKCNNVSKPGTAVFYHHVIPRGALVPFMIYSEFIGATAVQYPNLRIHVFFLIDDSRYIFDRPLCYHSNKCYEEFNKREIREFHERYSNVNTTVMLLSKFMAQTPLKYIWRRIPIAYLPFYARVYSVWQYGGIALDLPLSYTKYMTGKFDPRFTDILRLYNDGVKPEGFDEFLSKVSDDEQMFKMFYSIFSSFLLEAKSVMSNIMLISTPTLNLTEENVNVTTNSTTAINFETPSTDLNLIISKDRISNIPNTVSVAEKNESFDNTMGIELSSALDDVLTKRKVNFSDGNNTTSDGKENLYQVILSSVNTSAIKIETTTTSAAFVIQSNDTETSTKPNNAVRGLNILPDIFSFKMWKDKEKKTGLNKSPNLNKTNKQVVFVYDVFIEDGSNPFKIAQAAASDHVMQRETIVNPEQRIFVNMDGTFISASARFHPFLTHILNVGCRRYPPKVAIKEVLYRECSPHFFQDKVYCNSIHVF